jgi:hypothetical protein
VTNRLRAYTHRHRQSSWAIGEVGPMCDRLPSKKRRDVAADALRPAEDEPTRQRQTVDDLRRLAEACRDLDDPGGDGESLGRPA